jgi:hypothetical protein
MRFYKHLTIDHCILMFKLAKRFNVKCVKGRIQLLDRIYERDNPNFWNEEAEFKKILEERK